VFPLLSYAYATAGVDVSWFDELYIQIRVVYDVLAMTCRAVRALLCR
jgi:hypothetical protein